MKKIVILFLAGVLAGTLGCVSQPTHTSGYIPGTIPQPSRPTASEMSHSRSLLYDTVAKKENLKLRQEGNNYVRAKTIVSRLSQAAGLGNFSYPVYMADAGKRTNAFALNGNTIVVYDELARRIGNDEELAAILGHEVSHILGQHHKDTTSTERQAIVDVAATLIGSVIGSSVSATAGDIARQGTALAGSGAFVRSYDRAMEYEADQVGMLLMAKAGYDPEGAIRFWSKASSVLGAAGGGYDFFSTHPSHGNRMQRLRETLPTARKLYH